MARIDDEPKMAVERPTLAGKVEFLECGVKEHEARLRDLLEELENHHTRLCRVEREVGLLP